MAQSQEILNDVSQSKIKGITEKLRDFLNPLLEKHDTLKKLQLQYYKQFAVRFLHTFVSLKKSPTDKESVEEILQSSILCCDVTLITQRESGIDTQYTVPKLIYHILVKCAIKNQENLKDACRLSEQLFEMLQSDDGDIPQEAAKIIQAVYAILWNFAVRLIPKDLTDIGDLRNQILNQLGICLKLLSILPNHSLLLARIQDITIKHIEWKTLTQEGVFSGKDHGYDRHGINEMQCDILRSAFDQVIKRLVALCNQSADNKEQCLKHRRTLSQVRCVIIEWLIKMMKYDKAEGITTDLQKSACEEIKPVCDAVVKLYSVNIESTKSVNSKSDKHIENIVDKLSALNSQVDSLNLDNSADLWLLHRVYNNLMHTLDKNYFSLFSCQFTSKTVHILIESCDVFAVLCSLSAEQIGKEDNFGEEKTGTNTDPEKDDKKTLDYISKLKGWRLSAHYKQLEILDNFLQKHYDEVENVDIWEKMIGIASNYENLLAEHSSSLSEKSLQSERYNIGYFCLRLGKLLFSKENYKYAAPLLKSAGHHIHLYNAPKAFRFYELCVDCYRFQHLWLECSKVLVDVSSIGREAVRSAIGMWSKVKRDAIAKEEELFAEMTFSDIVENSGVEVKDYTKRDLLIIEYQEWMKFSERDFEVEHKLLTEMLNKSTTSIHKAEVMVELASNLFFTGNTYDDKPPGELLNKAIIMLDKCKENVKALLALAHYRKYIISHEETVERLCPSNKGDKDTDSEDTNKDTNKLGKPSTEKVSNKYNTPYTLDTEQAYRPYLIRAVELWESAFKGGSKQSEIKERLIDVDVHASTMLSCGTRLISMKQPAFALRVLQVACDLMKNTALNKQTLMLKIETAHALMLLGRFSETEEMVNTLESDEEALEKLLLMADLYLQRGKKEEGMALVLKVLTARKHGNMTHKMCLINGTAKRLLSMFLCFPGVHKLCPFQVDILCLASEAVKQHNTVLNLESKKGSSNKSLDKWLLVSEFLQSLLHLCQLFRFTGLSVKAEFYLQEGIKLSQAHGLPRWSCEFVFEALRTQSMLVNGQRSVAAVNSIRQILDQEFADMPEEKVSDSTEKQSMMEQPDRQVQLGVSKGAISKNQTGSAPSPEKEVPQQLSGDQRNEMSKLTIPTCNCVRDKDSTTCDMHVHRLYVEAGIVLSEFMSQYEMEADAYRILSDLQSKYPHYLNCFEKEPLSSGSGKITKPGQTLVHGCRPDNPDPHMKFLSLEAVCLKVESLLYQKKFDEVQEFWMTLKNWETKGFLNNVLHSDILMTRVALCQASSFMLSLQSTADKLVKTKLTDTTGEIKSFKKENSSCKRVCFADPVPKQVQETSNKLLMDLDNLCLDETTKVPQRKALTNLNKSAVTPVRSKSIDENKEQLDDLVGKLMLSAKKQKLNQVLGTPLTGRRAKLDFLMDSNEDDDDHVVFPTVKPITPKSVKSEKGKRVRSRRGKGSTDKTSLTDNGSEHSAPTNVPVMDALAPNKSNTKTNVDAVKGNKPSDKKQDIVVRKGRRTIVQDTENIKLGARTESKHDSSLHPSELKNSVHSKVDVDEFDFKPAADTKGKKKSVRARKGKVTTEQEEISVSNLDEIAQTNESVEQSVLSTCSDTQMPKDNKRKPLQKSNATKNDKLSLKGRKMDLKDPTTKRRNGETVDISSISIDTNKENESENVNCNVKKKGINEISEKSVASVLQLKGDVFDFDCSPAAIEKVKNKGKISKSTKRTDKTKAVNPTDQSKRKQSSKDKVTKVTPKTDSKTTTRRRNLRNDIESARTVDEDPSMDHVLVNRFDDIINSSIELDEKESSVDLLVTELHDIEHECWHSPVTFTDHVSHVSVPIPEPEDDLIEINTTIDIDPIEIFRGGTRRKGNERASKTTAGKANTSNKEDSQQRDQGEVEVVRSSDTVNMKDLMNKMSMDCTVDVSTEAPAATNENSLLQEEKVMELLEELCERISHFSPYPQYPKMCQVLAQKYVDTNPQRAAFLLSESMAVSFRHQAAVVRGKNKSGQSTRMSRDAAILGDVLTDPERQAFHKDESSLQTMVNTIPSDWCVIQVSVTSDLLQCQHFILTRFVKDRSPVVIEIPAFSTPQGRYVLKDFERLQERNVSLQLTTLSDWWKMRTELDNGLQEIIESMEKFWIGCWKGMFLPPVNDTKTVLSIKKEIKKVLKVDIDDSKLEVILLSTSMLSESQLQTCVKGLLGKQASDANIDAIISIVKKSPLQDKPITSQHHVILILDKNVQHLPWECLPSLCERSVSRMPCFSHLYYQLSSLTKQENSVYNKGVDPRRTFYILNPDGDLSHTEGQFKDWFKGEEGWKGICGTKPTKEQFIEALTDRDLLLYLGHGSGARYFPSVEIEKIQAQAVAVLMGCSSGKLHVKGQLEPIGIMTSYFLAGCPCMVANLWDVTDKDIDKYTAELLKCCKNAEDGAHLIPFVQKARKVCKMKYLVGCAPVVYGLPVFINRNNTASDKE